MTIVILTITHGFLFTMMIPTVPLLAKDAGVSELHLGILTTVPAFVIIVSCIPGNSLGLHFGRRTLIMWSQAAGFLGGLLFYFSNSMVFMIIPQIFIGISNALFWPSESAYQTEIIVPEKRATVIGYTMALSSLCSIVSPTVAGVIIDKAGYKPIFVLYMAMAGLGVLIAGTLPKFPRESDGSITSAMASGFSSVADLLKRPIIQVLTLNTLLLLIAMTTSEAFVPALMRELAYSATLIGMAATLRTAAMAFIRFFIGPLIKWFGIIPVLFAGVFSCAVAALVVPFFPTVGVIFASSILAGMGFGVSPVLTSTLIAENTDPKERGIAMALNIGSTNAGRTATGFGFGAVAIAVGYAAAIAIANLSVIFSSFYTMSRYKAMAKRARRFDQKRVEA